MQTHSISRHASTNVLHAFDFAKSIGRPLNCYVVLCCDEKGADKTAAKICQDVRDRYRAWSLNAAKRYGIERLPPVYIQTIENPHGSNPHANWVLHIPPALFSEFIQKLPRWLERAQGGVRLMDVSVQTVDPETDKTLAKYVIKGADSHYVDYFHLRDFAEPQGVVEGRRTCVSPAIGRTARKKAGFIPKLHRNDWKQGYVPPAEKPKRQIFINSEKQTALRARKTVKKAVWGGLDLAASEKAVEPADTPALLYTLPDVVRQQQG